MFVERFTKTPVDDQFVSLVIFVANFDEIQFCWIL